MWTEMWTLCSTQQDESYGGDWFRFGARWRCLRRGRPAALPGGAIWKWDETRGQKEAPHRMCCQPRFYDWRSDRWDFSVHSIEIACWIYIEDLFVQEMSRKKNIVTNKVWAENKKTEIHFLPQVVMLLTVWPSWRTRLIFWRTSAASWSASSPWRFPPGLQRKPWLLAGIEQVFYNSIDTAWIADCTDNTLPKEKVQ